MEEVARNTILIGVVGMSPAVLTETIWALAQESPPVIPDKVVAITTNKGRDEIHKILLGKEDNWKILRNTLKAKDKLSFGSSASIPVIGNGNCDFSDISSAEENEQAADFILKVIRQYTEDSDTQIIASIAGGRKTMSALMLSCMSLLGREQDRVCHVLANDDYIFSNKDFLYPKNKKEEKAAQIILSDIPFVRVRGLYAEKRGEAPTSYSAMVRLFHHAAPPAINYPKIEIDLAKGKIFADDEDLKLSPCQFVLLFAVLEKFTKQKMPFASWNNVKDEIIILMEKDFGFEAGWHEKMMDVNYRKVKWYKVAHEIRKKLNGKSWAKPLISSPGSSPIYPPSLISDIRGHPRTSEKLIKRKNELTSSPCKTTPPF